MQSFIGKAKLGTFRMAFLKISKLYMFNKVIEKKSLILRTRFFSRCLKHTRHQIHKARKEALHFT